MGVKNFKHLYPSFLEKRLTAINDIHSACIHTRTHPHQNSFLVLEPRDNNRIFYCIL